MDQPLIIITVGRSAGTTLLRILNTFENVNICGENMGAVFNLLEAYKNLKICSTKHIIGRETPVSFEETLNSGWKPTFYNIYKLNDIKEQFKTLIKNLLCKEGTNIWGFKEIRFNKNNINLLLTMKELFPNLKIIFNYSNDVERQSKSAWWAEYDSKSDIKSKNNILKDFYKNNNDFIYLNTMENIINNNLSPLFKFINRHDEYLNKTKTINNIINDNYDDKNHKFYKNIYN